MDLNLTIFCEFLIFAVFFLIIKKKLWPEFLAVLNERERLISAGLESSAKAKELLDNAKKEANMIVNQAQQKGQIIIDQTQHHIALLKEQAEAEISALHSNFKHQTELEHQAMLRKFTNEAKAHYADVAISVASRVLKKDPSTLSKALFEDAVEQLK